MPTTTILLGRSSAAALVLTWWLATSGATHTRAAADEAAPGATPHVVFVTGDCEYRSEITMPLIAEILTRQHGMRCSLCYSVDPETDEKAPRLLTNVVGLEALADADLAVFYLRYRQLPDEQLARIVEYVDSGRPLVGLRTTTHAFRYENGPHVRFNDGFGRDVFGQKWITHHGHDSSTNVYVAVGDHPVTRGLAPSFHCRSWLYQVTPLVGDCTPLLIGSAVKGEEERLETFGRPNPVAWTRQLGPTRVFFTTLGHPQDFAEESVRRLLVNGVYWALGREDEIPPEGAAVDLAAPYDPPRTTRAVPDPTLQRDDGSQYAQQEEGHPRGGLPSGG